MSKLYVNNNGNVLPSESGTIEAGNRGHLYGDGLFETIRIMNGKPINTSVHIMRMLDGMAALKMRIPTFFTERFFNEKFEELIQKSEIHKGGKIRLSIDRMRGGTYRPLTNEVTYFIEIYPIKENQFILNEKGLNVELYTTARFKKDLLSGFKTKNKLLNVMASIEAMEKLKDDLLLTNPKGNIIEGTNSNIFVVSNEILYTTALEEGCVGGTMRMTIINQALANNIRVYESSITPQNLLMADELFLSNAITGIRWVREFRNTNYDNKTAKKLVEILNSYFASEKAMI